MLGIEEKTGCLQKGIFKALDPEILAAIAGRMGERDMEDGAILFREGEPGDEIFVIVTGEVEIYSGVHTIAVLGQGQLLGEMAVLGGGLRTAGGRAKGNLKLLFLKDKAVMVLIQQIPELAFAIFQVLIDRLDEANHTNRFLSTRQKLLGAVKINSGVLKGKQLPIYHKKAMLGKARNSAADVLRIAIASDSEELCEEHAVITIEDGTVFIEPHDGRVSVNKKEITDCIAITPHDKVVIAGIAMRFAAKNSD